VNLPPDLLQRPPEEAARLIALESLEQARRAALRLDDPDDAEALHDFRVAIRRTRSTLRAWKGDVHGVGRRRRRALREIQNATGAGRDAEVSLQWLEAERSGLHSSHRLGHSWLVDRLSRRHREAMAEVRGQVRQAFEDLHDDLRDRLEEMTVRTHLGDAERGPRFGEVLAPRARAEARGLARLLQAVESADDEEHGHRARIACKRLRYLLEPLCDHAPGAADVVKKCKRIQDALGELHDAHVLREEIGAAVEAAGVEHARRLVELTREADAGPLRRASRRTPRSGLLELMRRVQRRIADLYATFAAAWLGEGAEALVAEVDRVADAIERAARAGFEIERKYLLRRLPPLAGATRVQEIDQGWLPGVRLRERIRRAREESTIRYSRTLKLGEGVVRVEIEEPTTEEVFERLWPLTKDCRIRKRRYDVPCGELTWEIDEFLDRELCLAEVELASPEARPELPEWLAPLVVREVTDDARYTNLALAESGERAPDEG
jgi:CHAD domain-containing protein/CYTH domain-containing protein